MNQAWHARRAKKEIRRGGDVSTMTHLHRLHGGYAVYLAWRLGYRFRIVLPDRR